MTESGFIIMLCSILFFPSIGILGVLWHWLGGIRMRIMLNIKDVQNEILSLRKDFDQLKKELKK